MSPAGRGVAPSRSSLLTRSRIQCAAGRASTTRMTIKLSKCQDHHRRCSPPTSTSSLPGPQPTMPVAASLAARRRRPLLLLPVPPHAIGFDLLGGSGSGSNNGDDDDESSSSSSRASPRDLLLASGRLILHREIMAENSSSSSSIEDSPAAAALALLRAVASPGGRNDGAASSAGAALAAALASRPSSSSGGCGGWKGFLLDEIVVGRNNPLARSVARGGSSRGGGGGMGGEGAGGDGDGDAGAMMEAAAASAAGAALAADLAALQSLAFDGATAAAWVRGSDPAVPRAWLDAFAAAVDGGSGGGEEAKEEEEDSEERVVSPPSPRLLPPLTRSQRARAARALSARARWADGAPDLIALWSRHGAGNVGSYFAFEWNPSSSSQNLIVPSVEDRGGGVRQGGENLGAAAALWDPVASRLAAWARGDRLAPFDGGRFAARLEAPPSSLAERGGSESDDGDEKKKEKKKKKEKGESFSSSSSFSASPSPSLSLWDGLRTSPVLLASGARLVRLPAVNSSSGGSLPLRGLWRALRLHPRARWVVVSDSFPPQGSGGGGGEAALAMEGELPPGVALAVRKR